MATVTYDGQCFSVDNRAVWVLGATLHYARIPRELWAEHIAAARQGGFNTIEAICPWAVHEPRRGQFEFDGQTDVASFVEACGEAGMRVALRLGPFVGDVYDGGGLPPWLCESPEIGLRFGNEPLFERVGTYVRKLAGALADLQVTRGGPILLVQCEHAWTCGHDEAATKYLGELTRTIREAGFDVPITNANDLWPADSSSISTWRGWDDLLLHLRQLRVVQPDAPRLVSTFDPTEVGIWGEAPTEAKSPASIQRHLAEVLAAGSQFIVNPFHASRCFGFTGGRLPGGAGSFVTSSPFAGALLGEAGHRGEAYQRVRRLVTFARSFEHVFAGLDPDDHPVVLAPSETLEASAPGTVHLRGAQGRVTFLFGNESTGATTLLLDDGLRMPIDLGGQPVSWVMFDVDLGGAGRLDYTNVCPFTQVGKTVVFFGAPKTTALLSINRTPLQATVPSGKKPVVLEHHGLTIVLCSDEQIDVTYADDERLYVGVSGFTPEGEPRAAEGIARATVVEPDGSVRQLTLEAPTAARQARSRSLTDWLASPADPQADGTSPRYATLDGPSTLHDCGAPTGYGWYRVEITAKAAKKRTCHAPFVADRLHLFLDGEPLMVHGDGPGAASGTIDLKLRKGTNVLVGLVDNLGRFSDGNDLGELKGWFGHLYETKKLAGVRPKKAEAEVVDPLAYRAFISGLATGQASDAMQAVWSFTHARKAPLLLAVEGASVRGTFVLNDVPIAYYAGLSGADRLRMLLEPSSEHFRRGKNELRFAPDPNQEKPLDRIMRATTLTECVDAVTDGAMWSFAKWEPPAAGKFDTVGKTGARAHRGIPCWWRTTFTLPEHSAPVWLDLAGLSKGQVYVNGHDAGRYFRATADGKAVRPHTRLSLPEPWLDRDGENELLVFDEHGFDPLKTKLLFTDGSE